MPRVVVGYNPDGSKRWSEHVPGNPGSHRIAGSLVYGASGSRDKDKRNEQVARYKAKVKGQKRIVAT